MDKDLLKAKVCAAIDDSAAEIEALANSIADEPELGFKEVKTSAKVVDPAVVPSSPSSPSYAKNTSPDKAYSLPKAPKSST